MVVAKTPGIIKALYSQLTWELLNQENKIYLTFDDGPTPDVTPWVLDLLRKHHIKATFFCLGKNVEAHPEIYQQILEEGHTVGNHTYDHPSGWKTEKEQYLQNISRAAVLIESGLFRPPYGRITKAQAKQLKEQYHIIMWNVLSGDYDPKVTAGKCLENVIKNTESGSIIVFHDSVKASAKLKTVLPEAIDILMKKGFIFDQIPAGH
ncbi:MAG: polysaccharide deacetylase family protein [Flavobacteriales bacterium]|nr:polysaccharide deacetylase family protein [Flavobacteriales bacterium]